MNAEKISALTSWLTKQELSGAIITNYHSVAYLSSFESDPIERVLALVLLENSEPFCLDQHWKSTV